ncbi:protein-disulfide reductase DsbD [Acidovorax sp. Root219]|uniref:protein-disulfide reductase DsbD family protein n=1 Tax=Acidovorax sp. Root219 TaxID=1736493 RepID=UPI00070E252D|nr:thioredoxin family protein [Acidovorax sp. Root219]KRC21201.1 protein-disulfide reductase [Acidovorax sp. Root219]
MHYRPTSLLAKAIFLIAVMLAGAGSWAQLPAKGGAATSAVVTTPHVRAELIAHAPQGVEPGQPLWMGLQITHQPEWHTYWKNPGDSGLPIEMAWTLPAGLDAGEIAWPLPKKIPIGTLANYGYEGAVLLPVPVTVASTFAPKALSNDATVRLRATWLVCRKECIPEEGDFTLTIPARSTTAMHGAAFDAALAAQPRQVMGSVQGVRPDSNARIEGNTLQLSVQGLPVELRGKTLELFPETPEVIENAAAWTQAWKGAVWTAEVPLAAQRSNSPDPMPVVLAADGQGYRAELKVLGAWPTVAAAATVSPALEAALKANAAGVPASTSSAPPLTLLAALLGALLGGLILNLMPCVFPVLAIKVVGFAQHAQDRRAHRLSGIAYTAGVVLSFVALGALMLALRAAGEAIGWGFQLQSPAVVAGLAALFTLIALNLAGVFEFGHFLPSSVASLQARHPVADSFLTGVLAVAVASPCTAPFMGASLGLTATLPGPQALAVFAALGLGLALPYLAAAFVPAVARALPRPGAWMDTLRKFMAFPMLATVVWLVWVLGQQSGIDGAGALLILLVALGMVAWALSLAGSARRFMAPVSILALALLAWTFAPHVTNVAAAPSAQASTGNATQQWQAWTPGAAEQLVASGRPVFVDFTAAWCVTCQYNKKTTLADAGVQADFTAKNVALLRADWTRRDPAITAALAQLGRSGVPVYVLHAPGKAPVVFSEILGEAELRAAVAAL